MSSNWWHWTTLESESIGSIVSELPLAEELYTGRIAYPEAQTQQCVILSLPADADEHSRQRFAREAMIGLEVSRDHEHLLTTLHFGRSQDGRLFIAFEHVTGCAVSENTDELFGDVAVLRNLAEGTLRALNYLHRRGIAHGSVIASNLLIGHDGIVRLGNFSRATRIVSSGDGANDLRSLGELLFGLISRTPLSVLSDACVAEFSLAARSSEILSAITELLDGTGVDTSSLVDAWTGEVN